MGTIYSINTARKKKVSKDTVNKVLLVEDLGIEGDAHASSGKRQISFLPIESIREQDACVKVKEARFPFNPGDFAENITTKGIDLSSLQPGDTLKLGNQVILNISKKGRHCYKFCTLYPTQGDCRIPAESIFAKVIKGGEIKIGDKIQLLTKCQPQAETFFSEQC